MLVKAVIYQKLPNMPDPAFGPAHSQNEIVVTAAFELLVAVQPKAIVELSFYKEGLVQHVTGPDVPQDIVIKSCFLAAENFVTLPIDVYYIAEKCIPATIRLKRFRHIPQRAGPKAII